MAYSAIEVIHISAGSLSLLSGAGALIFQKGGRLHRAAGNVFFPSMLIMSSLGAYLAYFVPDYFTLLVGVITFYFVTTAWVTVMRDEGASGLFEIGALIFPVSIIVAALIIAVNPDTGAKGFYYFIAGVAFFSAGLDISVIFRRGVYGRQRIARHLWRMCFALFIAAISFFIGQADVFPEPFRIVPALSAPPLTVLGVMFYWLIRVLFTKWYNEA